MSLHANKIFLIGLMGSGKSYWGRHLAMHFRFPFLDLDKGIEMADHRSVSAIFEQEGEASFRQKEHDTLHRLNKDYPKFIMSCGGGTPCFYDNMDWMLGSGTVMWLNPPLEVLAQRLITGKEKRPAIKNANTEQEIMIILEGWTKTRFSFYERSHFVIDKPFPTLEMFENLLTHA